MNIDELTLGQIKQITSMSLSESQDTSEYKKYIGKRPVFYCMNYIYSGDVAAVEGGSIVLDNGVIVYDTGKHSDINWSDAEKLPDGYSVAVQSIESHGLWK